MAAEPGTFEQLAAQGENVDVAIGVALLARDVYGDVDPTSLLRHFDAFAAPLVALGLEKLPLREQHEAIAQRLFIELDFHGNEDDYYDPKNSLLPDVIERRPGQTVPGLDRSRGAAADPEPLGRRPPAPAGAGRVARR